MLSLPFDFRGRLCKGREGKRKGREGKGIEIMIVIHRIQFAAAAGLASLRSGSLSQCSVELKKREVFKNVIIKY